MANIFINYTPGGDETTDVDDLIFHIWDGVNVFRYMGSVNTDPEVTRPSSDIIFNIDVADATTYSFRIREIDEAGNYGPLSDALGFTTD
jgi:hypothetical protein